MSDNELRSAARNLLDVARTARTPSDQHRERAYQALVAGLGGSAAVGTAKVAAAAAKSTFAWLKWAIPAALVMSGGAGAYVWSSREPAPPPAPQVAPKAPPAAPVALPAPVNEEPAVALPSAAPNAESKPAQPALKGTAKPSGDALVQELSLLHEALAASRSGNAARALELAREHARQYPASRLGIERSAIEVRSLCSLGRPAEARKVADRLRARAPSSPVSAALKDTCVGK
ncbi:MAG TPA: hypothetical protein VHP33_18445 [Polyangiaceae bacterium]|nr:hypothetical protein [Polyangiaceae bacterium]